jgi:hypothetical protein
MLMRLGRWWHVQSGKNGCDQASMEQLELPRLAHQKGGYGHLYLCAIVDPTGGSDLEQINLIGQIGLSTTVSGRHT